MGIRQDYEGGLEATVWAGDLNDDSILDLVLTSGNHGSNVDQESSYGYVVFAGCGGDRFVSLSQSSIRTDGKLWVSQKRKNGWRVLESEDKKFPFLVFHRGKGYD